MNWEVSVFSGGQSRLSGLMDHDIMRLSALSLAEFMADGHSIDGTSDLGEYEHQMMKIGARESHPMMSGLENDFASRDSLGLMIRSASGEYLGGIAARFVDLGPDDLASHMEANYSRTYAKNKQPAIVSRLSAAQSMKGRIVYQGQWYMVEGVRGGGVHVPALFHYFHCLCCLKWHPDWFYGFFPVRLAERAFSCGYPRAYLQAHDWRIETERRGPHECLVCSSFEELAERAASLLEFPASFPARFGLKSNN